MYVHFVSYLYYEKSFVYILFSFYFLSFVALFIIE